MRGTSTKELRKSFLEYFQERGHTVVPSSPLVPANDPTLLFTNAGMVQFKDVFLGRENRGYARAASCQRCVRAGGKHNDLENVGYTARHHTFFEMLGNFSFGDYFKREAIGYAWEFLTRVLGLPSDRLWVTVYEDDDEASDIWLKELHVDPARFARCGADDNFWSMGETGPCGPCTEIFYDHGPEVPGGPPGSPEADGDRYVEIWNLVFMQYDRGPDGRMTLLPRPSVDTGMGLERLAAVLQGVHSNYRIDVFRDLMQAAAEQADVAERDSPSLRVIADHIRASAFLIVDGVLPANEGRGYVLRRIIRRAARHGAHLGLKEPFFYRLVEPLCGQMADVYPELGAERGRVEQALKREEERFAETLEQGLRILDEKTAALTSPVIPGELVFLLYDTYGFPTDLTLDIARERRLQVDMTGFEREMEKQRERARAASQFAADYAERLEIAARTEFTGYEHLVGESSVVALMVDGEPRERMEAGQEGAVVLERTPFYAEAGGQVGDRGVLRNASTLFEVQDTRKLGSVHAHLGNLRLGALRVGDRLRALVDGEARAATARNHSATHLLHSALRQKLGEHVTQKGSLVAPDRLRFDFSHTAPLTRAEILAVERLVNHWIVSNSPVETSIMALEEALSTGAMALFGEKYDQRVRVLRMGDYSTELCGGTHVARTGDIGLFKIVGEGGVAAGIRRIEALTGEGAVAWVESLEDRVQRASERLKTAPEQLEERLTQWLDERRQLEKEVERLKATLANRTGTDLVSQAEELAGIKLLVSSLEGADAKVLRETADQLKNRLGSAIVVLGAVRDGKVMLVAGVTSDLTPRVKAGELVDWLSRKVGGKGGGRPDMAQGGGTDPARLPQALQEVAGWLRERL
jgi:alanyl-tRNA synthetase